MTTNIFAYSSALRIEAVTKQLEYIRKDNFTKNKFDRYNYGSVLVRELVFFGRERKKNKWWYVCTVSCCTEVFATAPTRADADGAIVFHEKFEIKPPSSNFEITVTLYGMRLKRVRVLLLMLFIVRLAFIPDENYQCMYMSSATPFTEVWAYMLQENENTSLL